MGSNVPVAAPNSPYIPISEEAQEEIEMLQASTVTETLIPASAVKVIDDEDENDFAKTLTLLPTIASGSQAQNHMIGLVEST